MERTDPRKERIDDDQLLNGITFLYSLILYVSTDFAAALANPIAYQSQLEKHARQLAILEDFDSEVSKNIK